LDTLSLLSKLMCRAVTPTTPITTGQSEVKPLPAGPRRSSRKNELPEQYTSRGFWGDLKTGRWMLVPCESRIPLSLRRTNTVRRNELTVASSFIIMSVFPILYYTLEYARKAGIIKTNYVKYLLFLQGKLPNGQYKKAWSDLLFVLHHVIFWSLYVFIACVLCPRRTEN
jgi:acyl-CoA-dependent ceramide synthase